MIKSLRFLFPAVILVLAISGCQQESAPASSNATEAQLSATAKQDGVPATYSSVLSITPSTVTTCDPGVVATVNWDVQAARVTTSSIEIWVGSDSTNLKLFSAGSGKGQTQTGPWTHPGTHFVLKNKDDGKVLADVTVGGPKCP